MDIIDFAKFMTEKRNKKSYTEHEKKVRAGMFNLEDKANRKAVITALRQEEAMMNVTEKALVATTQFEKLGINETLRRYERNRNDLFDVTVNDVIADVNEVVRNNMTVFYSAEMRAALKTALEQLLTEVDNIPEYLVTNEAFALEAVYTDNMPEFNSWQHGYND